MTYKIKIAGTAHEFECGDDEPLLDAALREGLDLPFDCQVGGCGACRVKVVEGEVHYDLPPMALTQEEEEAGMALGCQAIASSHLLIEVEGLASPQVETDQLAASRRVTARVRELSQLCHDVMRVELELGQDQPIRFRAGQYLDLILSEGSRRSFSMASAPESGVIDLHVRHVPGGEFTEHLFRHAVVGDTWELELPLGNFFLREDTERPLLLVAGGTGLAPIKSMLESAMARGVERRVCFYWGVRSQRDLYLHDAVTGWAERIRDFYYCPVLSEPEEEDGWQGATGFVHEAVVQDFEDLSGFDAYLCGPPVMIQAAKKALAARGLPVERIFADSFSYAHTLSG